MQRFYASELPHHVGSQLTLAGWFHRFRQLRNVSFLILRDRTGLAQIVIEDAALAGRLSGMHMETVLSVTGTVVAEANAPNGVELHNPVIECLAPAAEPPVFDLFRPRINAQMPTILDNASLALRHPSRNALWRIAAAAMSGFRQTLQAEGFTEIQTPKIVSSATESGANVFEIDYFGTPAYLAQSPQFYKQMMVGVFERVFEVGPVFRAEPSATTRHLAQYTSLDVEMGFIENHYTVMALLRNVIAGMVAAVGAQRGALLAEMGVALPTVPQEIPAVHFSKAHERYSQVTGEDTRRAPDLSPAQERWLGTWAQETYGSAFLFVTGYPMVKRPFYTHPDPIQPEYSNSFDLLFNGVELVTGGQRLHRYADYLATLEARGMEAEPLRGYLDTFKHGMPPHGGFAIGLERFVAQLTGAQNVREVALFPRDMMRVAP